MLDESLRRRLEALNRGQLPRSTKLPPRASKASGAARGNSAPSPSRPLRSGLLARGVIVNNSQGDHLIATVPLAEIWPEGDALLSGRHDHLKQQPPNHLDACRASFLTSFPDRFVALDLETCGLSGSALFLIGLARREQSHFIIELLFARTYAEEAAVLASLGERLAAVDTLVTFNGKSFDWPMVTDRWARHLLHRNSPLPNLVQYDVLHHARRAWRKTLPDCKLQTIERMICRRSRAGDIAGHLIPSAYDHYVRTGATIEMDQVLYHNAVDLVTLLDVAMRLAR